MKYVIIRYKQQKGDDIMKKAIMSILKAIGSAIAFPFKLIFGKGSGGSEKASKTEKVKSSGGDKAGIQSRLETLKEQKDGLDLKSPGGVAEAGRIDAKIGELEAEMQNLDNSQNIEETLNRLDEAEGISTHGGSETIGENEDEENKDEENKDKIENKKEAIPLPH